jgi:hypothetical protein
MSGVQIPYSALNKDFRLFLINSNLVMKKRKLKKLIQKPLRFHHQDIHEELDQIKEMLNHVICQMQNLQCRIDQYEQDSVLRVPESNGSEG